MEEKRTAMLWSVSNGYTGYSKVACLLLAANEAEALSAAQEIFEESERKSASTLRREPDATYWSNLEAHPVQLPYLGDELP